MELRRAYRLSGGAVQTGSLIATLRYDGLGRTIHKMLAASGSERDCTYHHYYDLSTRRALATSPGR